MQLADTPAVAPAAPAAAEGGHGPRKIADIERLRGLAILMVVFVHLPLPVFLCLKVGLDPMSQPFWLGVNLFFVISGYVVMKSFIASKLSVWKFYVRRVFRLWPILFAFFALSALVNCLPTIVTVGWDRLLNGIPPIMLAYVTVYQAKHPMIFYYQAMWSLSVEEQFYLVAPALLVLLWYLCRGREKACGRFFVGAYLVIGVVLRLLLAYDKRLGLHLRQLLPWTVQYISVWQFDFIALGVILYFRGQQVGAALSRLAAPLQRVLIWACVTAPLVLMYALGPRNMMPWDKPAAYSFGLIASGLAFYLAVGLGALDKNLLYVGRGLDRVLMYWGTRSYGIYVFHYPILAFTYWLAPYPSRFAYFNGHPIAYESLRAVLVMALGLPVIELLYRYVEQPGINLGRRLIQRLSGKRREPGAQPGGLSAAPVQRAA